VPWRGVAAAGVSFPVVTVFLRSAGATAVVDPAAGGRLVSLSIGGDEVLASVPHSVVDGLPGLGHDAHRDWYRGSFPLAPWAGRLRSRSIRFDDVEHVLGPGSTIHGLVAEREWTVVTTPTSSSVALAVPIGPEQPGGWPFDGLVQQAFQLTDSALRMRLEIHSQAGRMPAIAGFHPWFRRSLRTGAAVVEFSPGRRLVQQGDRYVRTTDLGPRPWDDLFVDLAAPPSISWPAGPTLTLISDAPIWVNYERMPEGFCLEPWTGPPDGLGTDWAAVVTPGQPLVLDLTITFAPAGAPVARHG
jgi:aldose 1-epimerase